MINPQAETLNHVIQQNNVAVFSMLSDRGKAIFFPKKGILGQSADAKGKDINATIGMALEDDGSPLCLKSISSLVDLPKADLFNYAPSYGKPELRKKWKEMLFSKNPSLEGEISTPVVTNALTHGLSICGYMFLDESEEIIIPDPYWGNYNLIFSNAYGAKVSTFPLFKDNKLNIGGLKDILMSEGGKKVVLLNFPNNPTGYTPSEKEIPEIIRVIQDAATHDKKIVVLIDDAYFGLVYEKGIHTESIFSKLAHLHKNVLAVKLDGATKEDYVWGFRVGFITYGIKGGDEALYKALEDKTAGAIRGNISNGPHISQSLLLKAFTNPDYPSEKKEKYNTLKRRYEKVKEIFAEHPEYKEFFEPLPFNSGYFMCIKLTDRDPEKVRQILLDKYSTGIIALKDMIRIAYSGTPYNLLDKLYSNIYKACIEA
jgi:aspartate/methionine/tyrosine aminotransferase